MNLGKFTIGTDPELFCHNGIKYLSAIPLVKGTKEDAEKLPSGATIQHDNVAVEFATEPTTSKVQFVNKIGRALKEVKAYLPDNVKLKMVPSANFSLAELKDPEAREFGCSPDYCAWTRRKNNPPQDAGKKLLRSCGGHIHVGYVEGSENNGLQKVAGKIHTVKMMDLFHGLVSTVLDCEPEAVKRRELYGKAGCYRKTAYGVEYRTLSNYWLKSPTLVMLMYHLTDDVLTLIRQKKSVALLQSVDSKELRSIIEEGKLEDALEIIRTKLLKHMSIESKALFDICFFDTLNYDFEKEWGLNK